jgi:hypothetical protein
MRRLAILVLLALQFAVCGCANNTPSTVTNTSTTGNWEAQLINPSGGQASLLNFVVAFKVTNSGPLNITGFGFFNENTCFAKDFNTQKESGNASFTTDSAGHVTGTLSLKITSSTTGSVLTLTSNPDGLTGSSNGTTTTTGTLSNGVVVGTWTLMPGANASAKGCDAVTAPNATFVMCQNAATCSTAAALAKPPENQASTERNPIRVAALFDPPLSFSRPAAIK